MRRVKYLSLAAMFSNKLNDQDKAYEIAKTAKTEYIELGEKTTQYKIMLDHIISNIETQVSTETLAEKLPETGLERFL
jgi:hypothetical protein